MLPRRYEHTPLARRTGWDSTELKLTYSNDTGSLDRGMTEIWAENIARVL